MILKNTNTITEKIKGLANADNRILVVIDDVHSPKSALIFNVIKNIQPLNKEKKDNIYFLLAARQPDFDWVFDRNLFGDYKMAQKINGIFGDNYKYIIEPF